jgi:hypothetical protein
MKKNSLTTAIVAGFAGVAGLAGVANAVNLNPDGLGQVLIYPYYTVNGGNATLISVVNTTAAAKAVKVRFLESLNSAEVLDFNLYLSPFDVWAAEITAAGTGAQLTTADRSCTVPNVFANQPVAFRTFEFEENNPDILGLLGESSQERLRQGHVEMIEMGTLFNITGFGPATAVTHGASGIPSNCAVVENAWAQGGNWSTTQGALAVNAPTGGLFGAGTIVDVAFGRALPYNADALDGFWTNAGIPDDDAAIAATRSQADLHEPPGTIDPTLANVRTAPTVATARIFDTGFPDAVSAVLMSRFIYNEYNISTGLAAASEWVITFPTKRLHTYVGTSAAAPANVRPFSDNVDSGSPASLRDGLPFDTNGACDAIAFRYWDREERTTTTGVDFSPPRATPGLSLCWESNVLAFNQSLGTTTATAVLGVTAAQGANGVSPIVFQQGWARIEFDDPSAGGFQNFLDSGLREGDNNRVAVIGLPVVGFWAADYLNANVAAGVRANFGGINKHRQDRDGYLMGVGAAPIAIGASFTPAGGTWTGSN